MHRSDLLTTRQVADRLAVDSSTVRRWVLTGLLVPTVTTPGGHHRFDPDVLVQMSPAGPQPACAS